MFGESTVPLGEKHIGGVILVIIPNAFFLPEDVVKTIPIKVPNIEISQIALEQETLGECVFGESTVPRALLLPRKILNTIQVQVPVVDEDIPVKRAGQEIDIEGGIGSRWRIGPHQNIVPCSP